MNRATLIGNLTKDPDMRQTQSGVSVCTFTLAVQRRYADQNGEKQADFFNVVCWRGLAENCGKYLTKGSKAGVYGSIQNRSYEDKQGNKRKSVEVIADEVHFAEPKRDSYSNPAPRMEEPVAGYGIPSAGSDFSELSDDDGELPF